MNRRDFLKRTGIAGVAALAGKLGLGKLDPVSLDTTGCDFANVEKLSRANHFFIFRDEYPPIVMSDETAIPQGSHVNNAEMLSYKYNPADADPCILWEIIEPEDELGTLTDPVLVVPPGYEDKARQIIDAVNGIKLAPSPPKIVGVPLYVDSSGKITTVRQYHFMRLDST